MIDLQDINNISKNFNSGTNITVIQFFCQFKCNSSSCLQLIKKTDYLVNWLKPLTEFWSKNDLDW